MESTIRDNWDSVCEEAQLTPVDKALMWQRQFLNPFSTERF
jgi:serine/threonine-protein kinase HipA